MTNKSNHNISEPDLIKGAVAGDRRMQEELYNRFAPKMYAVCLRYANNANDAQDLLQEGFIKVYRNLHRFRAEGSFEGWMRRVFVNTSIEYFRKKSAQLSSVSEKEENTIEDSDITALDQLAEKDIIAIIQELSPGYRTVFNLYVVEGYSHKEIGEMLGISEGTSKSKSLTAEKDQSIFERYPEILYKVTMASNIQQTLASLEVIPPQGSWEQLSARLDAEYDLPEITLAQKLEAAALQPPSGAWTAIAAALPLAEEATPARPAIQSSHSAEAAPAKVLPFSLRKIAAAAAVLGIIALGSWYFLRSDGTGIPPVQQPTTAQKENQPANTTPATQPAIAAPVIAQRNDDQSIRPLRAVTDKSDNSNDETSLNKTDQVTAGNESQQEIPPANPAIIQATDVAGPASIPNRPFRDATGRVVMDMNLINNPGTQYVTVTAPNGEQTRMNKKFLPILTFLNTGADNGQFNTSLKQRFQNWRNQLIQQASFVPSATNFLDIMELKELLQDK